MWFKKFGWIHYPVSWQGWLTYLFAALFMVNTFWVIDHRSHSVSDTLYGIFPFWIPTLLLLEWIASQKDRY